uniref:N-acetyltransferase domain-containing protein n=1 Tax=Psilocybe cubensis TaxID=181762 RepID=A0A8H7XQV0_PSICU
MDTVTKSYDINFCLPIPEVLENDRVRLTPFIPRLHAESLFEKLSAHPEIFRYLPFGPYSSIDEFLTNLVENRIRKDPEDVLFAIFDKTKPSQTLNGSKNAPGALAGVIGFLNTSAPNLATEIGFVMILPQFQRTHVTSNAIGLLLNFTLNPPSTTYPEVLGLRRVVWKANSANKASIRAAERMGFTVEGILRWDRVLPIDREGNGLKVRETDPKRDHQGRDTVVLSLCWDNWEAGVKEHVQKVMNRVE